MPAQRRKRSTVSRKIKSKGPLRSRTRTLTVTRATGRVRGRKVAGRKSGLIKRVASAMAR